MCNRFLIIMFVLIHLMFIVAIAQQVKGEERNQRETVREISELRQDWMKEILNVNKELLDVQAVIAKDEESTTNCMTGTRKTHNLKAPLVVVVGVLKSKPQVIRVNNYEIHPEHIAFPYNSQHSIHNIAVIKLACRIATEHFAPIELPNSPFTELCPNDNCMVAIIRKVGKTSNVIYDTWAKHIPLTRRKRGLTETTIELENNNTFKTPPANIEEKLNEMLVAQRRVKLNAKQDILPNNINQTVTGFSKMEKSMPVKIAKEKRNFAIFNKLAASSMASDNLDEHVFQNDSNRNNKVRLFSVRASDGFQGCPQTGSPVMFGRVQAALVSVSCDDRQPGTPWKYTDIYSNLEWIRKITGVMINASVSRSPSDSVFGCTTCIYNFFIDLTGPNETLNCTDVDILTNNKFCASNYEKQDYSRSIITQKTRYSRLTETNQNQLNESKSKINQNRKLQPNSHKSFRNFIQRILQAKNLKHMKNNYNREELSKDGKNGKKGKNYQTVTGESKRKESDSEKNRKFMKLNKINENVTKEEDNTNERGIKLKSIDENFPNKSKNGNRLKKQVEIDKTPINEFDYSMMKTIKSQPSIDYNLLENKFHNLRMLLARLQKSMPAKEIRQTSMIGKPIRILPYGRIFNPTI